MKPIIQSSTEDSGYACMVMIASHYGTKSSISELKLATALGPQPLEKSSLNELANHLGLSCREHSGIPDKLNVLSLPCIIQCKQQHFMVLEEVEGGRVQLLDPVHGRLDMTEKQFVKQVSGGVLELGQTIVFASESDSQDHSNVHSSKRPLLLRDVLNSLTGIIPIFIQLFVLSALMQAFSLISPYYMQLVIDDVLVSFDTQLLKILAITFTILLLINLSITCLRGLTVAHFGAELNRKLGIGLFHHLIRLPLDYFEQRHIGDITSRFGSLRQIKQLLTGAMVESFIDGMMAVSTLVMIFVYSPRLAAIVVVSSSLLVIIKLLMYRPLRTYREKIIVSSAAENSHFIETVRSIQGIKLANIESKRMLNWQKLFSTTIDYNIGHERLNIYFAVLSKFVFGLENIIILYVAALSIMDQVFTIGMLTAFMVYKSQFSARLTSLIDKAIEFKMISLHLERLSDIAQSNKEQDLEPKLALDCKGTLTLNGITLQNRSTDRPLFDDLNLNIQAGECVAITGPSGCGKTTLIKIILGLLTPDQGRVTVDGIDIREVGLGEYRSHIGAVMQSDCLLSGSVGENIAGFDTVLNRKQLIKAASLAAIHDDIVKMPMGYDTKIGEIGTMFSGGQVQRIFLARALYHSPQILFLDEASSNLDIGSERRINESLSKLNITRVIVAHRPETIAMADRVLELRGGGLIERTALTVSKIKSLENI